MSKKMTSKELIRTEEKVVPKLDYQYVGASIIDFSIVCEQLVKGMQKTNFSKH